MRPCASVNISRAGSRAFPATPIRACLVAGVVMPCMALGVVATRRRKTCFPTGVTANPQKAKSTITAMAFCVYINDFQEYLLID